MFGDVLVAPIQVNTKSNFVKPDDFKLSVIERIRFGTTAYLWTGEADPDVRR